MERDENISNKAEINSADPAGEYRASVCVCVCVCGGIHPLRKECRVTPAAFALFSANTFLVLEQKQPRTAEDPEKKRTTLGWG